MNKQKIIIIGAGAAGLMAALELADQYDVTILEARSRLGGRMHSIPSKHSSFTVESGAEFVHGRLPITLELLKRAGIKYVPVKGNMYRKEKGKWKEQDDMIEGWDEVIKKMKSLETDMTMGAFLEKYYAGDEYTDIRRHITSFTEGFDIADVKKVSVQSLYKEWSNEEGENFRIPEGYSALVKFLEEECKKKGCKILTDQLVKQIDWERGEVTVYTINEQKYNADKAIITIPLTLLQKAAGKGSINFTPALDDYIKATEEIGIGAVIKVVLLFKQTFWQKDAGFIFGEEIFPTWWGQLPDKTPLLTGWLGGPRAERLSHHSEEDILEKALLSLASIYDNTIEELKENLIESHVFNWQNDEYCLGAYSYPMPESNAARQLLNTPISDTLFFAGEALYEGTSPGTVEAALSSGREVGKKLAPIP